MPLPITLLTSEPPTERPTDGEMLGVLADHFDTEPEEVLRWLDCFNAEEAIAQHRAALGIAT